MKDIPVQKQIEHLKFKLEGCKNPRVVEMLNDARSGMTVIQMQDKYKNQLAYLESKLKEEQNCKQIDLEDAINELKNQ